MDLSVWAGAGLKHGAGKSCCLALSIIIWLNQEQEFWVLLEDVLAIGRPQQLVTHLSACSEHGRHHAGDVIVIIAISSMTDICHHHRAFRRIHRRRIAVDEIAFRLS